MCGRDEVPAEGLAGPRARGLLGVMEASAGVNGSEEVILC